MELAFILFDTPNKSLIQVFFPWIYAKDILQKILRIRSDAGVEMLERLVDMIAKRGQQINRYTGDKFISQDEKRKT